MNEYIGLMLLMISKFKLYNDYYISIQMFQNRCQNRRYPELLH